MTVNGTIGKEASAAAFMQRLRKDHAGLSRMLRAIDSMVDRLATEPDKVQPILLEAFEYLLRYQHGYHHPREDRLFSSISGKQPTLAVTLAELAEEHETGERETAELAADLAAATSEQLRGKQGERLNERVRGYIRHARLHMRNEEAVFYARAEQVLDKYDWAEIIDQDGLQDPLADKTAFGNQYPNLAAHFKLATGHPDRGDAREGGAGALHLQMLALTDLYGGLLHEGFDLARRNVNRLLAVRGPFGLARAVGAITSDNLRFAGQCLTRPSRWAIDTGTDLLVARIKPNNPDS